MQQTRVGSGGVMKNNRASIDLDKFHFSASDGNNMTGTMEQTLAQINTLFHGAQLLGQVLNTPGINFYRLFEAVLVVTR